MTTFSDLLADRLRRRPGDPLVTYYDAGSGERTELSATTYANWAAKTASLFVDELDLGRGDRVRIALPPHWLGPVFAGAAWLSGLAVTPADDAELVVCGPDPRPRVAPGRLVLATALLPLGGRFAEPLPPGVIDYGVAVWGQPDGFVPLDPPGPDDAAVSELSQADLWRTAADDARVRIGGRLLTTADPLGGDGSGRFAAVVARDASLVLVRGGDDSFLAHTYDVERATDLDPA